MFSNTGKSADSERAEKRRIVKEGMEEIRQAIKNNANEMKTELIQQGYDEKEADEIVKKAAAKTEAVAIKEYKEQLKQSLEEIAKEKTATATPTASASSK